MSVDEETKVLPEPLDGQGNTFLIQVSFLDVIDWHGGAMLQIMHQKKCAILERGIYPTFKVR